jgi:hypothetical protein
MQHWISLPAEPVQVQALPVPAIPVALPDFVTIRQPLS